MNDGKPTPELSPPVAGPATAAPASCGVAPGSEAATETPRAHLPGSDLSDHDLPDHNLIEATLAGDTAAFGRLVRRYQDRLYNSLLRFTGSAEDAQDLAQEAFVQAFTKLDRFRRDSAFFTWLYRIAMNRAVSATRKRRERVSLDGLKSSGGDGADPACDAPPEARAVACERVELVQRALATLAEEHRQVLVLREFDGLDYQEIAEVIEVPVGTVRSRLFRARSQLRDALAPLDLGES